MRTKKLATIQFGERKKEKNQENCKVAHLVMIIFKLL